MTISAEAGLGAIGVINLVRNDFVPELSLQLTGPLRSGELIINARVEMPPAQIHQAVVGALADVSERKEGLQLRVDHEEHFRPGKPQPTHRLSALTGT